MSNRFNRIDSAEFRLLVERNADGLLVVGGEGAVLLANPSACQLFGRSAEEMVGSHLGLPLVVGETTDISLLRPDGDRVDVEMRAVVTDWEGEPALLASLRDVSARRELEEQMRQVQKMEAVGRLTAGVAHDFNNLLTVVIGNLEVLQRQLGRDPSGPRVRRAAENAMEGARRAAGLTQQLLAFSRRQPLTPKAVDVNALLLGMSDLLRRTLGEGVRVETRLAPELWRTIADVNQLESAVLNLAVNARDAMEGAGRLVIETSNVASNGADGEARDAVAITVRDTGAGMSSEVLAQAFEPFFTTKGVGKGTGLGLSQVYGFVTQSGGRVEIDSAVGAGASVTLYLPRWTGPDELPVERRPESSNPMPNVTRVLLVEDDAGVREFSHEALVELGYEVTDAPDGDDALRRMQSQEFDVLFSDLALPGSMNGRKLAEVASRLQPGLRTLLTSAYAGGALVKDGRLEEGYNLLPKPFTPAELDTKLKALLEDGPQGRARILVVEDDPLVRTTVVLSLADSFHVEEASTAGEALAKLKRLPNLDAVIIDVGLPDMKGDELAAEIRALRPGMPLVLTSGYVDRLAHSEQEGVNVLEKPFDGEALRGALMRLNVLDPNRAKNLG
ncbi:hybrid sensor histidine kinase/response regulator [Alsobacter soli]|uniref:histidine kinase n=1 Tax=Alsobacter soli TaxID=2109933 RepID=A0A2T1HW84_9HYPH|nr:response regulator [Alsobacter soli]PSC05943.1 hybrid sensor histidine kinase/response regulator [Alsobacter soli]